MVDRIVEQLNAIPILSDCSQAELEALAEHARCVTLPRGQRVITQGQPSDALYILLTGSADVITDGQVEHQVLAGEIVGEISMLSQGEATASVVPRSDGWRGLPSCLHNSLHHGQTALSSSTCDLPTSAGGEQNGACLEPAGAIPCRNLCAQWGRRFIEAPAVDPQSPLAPWIPPPGDLQV